MKEVNIGSVGVGGIFQAHLRAYILIPEARIVALADPSEASLKIALKRMKNLYYARIAELKEKGLDDEADRLKSIIEEVRVYKDYRKMLERENLDLVDICTPHKFHKPIAIDALKYGVNVMVEKPMARTYIEALEIVEVVEETGKLFQINENYIFSKGIYKLRKLIDSGILGEVEYLIVPGSHEGPERKEWFWDPDIGGGGSLVDMGCHAIGVAWYLVNLKRKPIAVKAEKFNGITIKAKDRIINGCFREITVEDDAHVLIKFIDEEDSSWTTALIEGSWTGKEYENIKVFGTNALAEIRTTNGEAIIKVSDYLGAERSYRVDIREDFVNTLMYEIRNMCECVLTGKKSLLNEKFGAKVMEIIDAAYYSEMKGRKTVYLEDFEKFIEKFREKYKEKASDEFIKMKVSYFSKVK